MKVQIAWLSLGLALGSIVIQPAHAADFGNSGGSTRTESYRDVGVPAAIPVPAPVPIPEYRGGWYFRFDAGVGVISQPSFTEEGFIYGKDDGPGPVTGPADPITLSTSWFNGDFDTFSTVGGRSPAVSSPDEASSVSTANASPCATVSAGWSDASKP